MLGKYSPTVSALYAENQKWFEVYSRGEMYDPDGYDSYGYNSSDIDRAGNEESAYALEGGETLYENTYLAWLDVKTLERLRVRTTAERLRSELRSLQNRDWAYLLKHDKDQYDLLSEHKKGVEHAIHTLEALFR